MKVTVKKKVPAGAATPTSNHKNRITIIIAENRRERKTQWTKCPDALPNKSGDYLALTIKGTAMVLPFSQKHTEWNYYDILPAPQGRAALEITHWMPIPALPKEATRP